MSEKKNDLPDWVQSTRANIPKVKRDLEIIQQAGRAEIKRDLEKEELARDLQQELDYVGRVVFQDLPNEMWHDELVVFSGAHLDGALSGYERESGQIAYLVGRWAQAGEDQHQLLTNTLSNTGAQSASAVYLSAAIEHRLEANSPAYAPLYLVDTPEKIGSRQEKLIRLSLDSTLGGIQLS